MKSTRIVAFMLALMLLGAISPLTAASAAIELPASGKAALDKTVAAASSAQKTAINKLWQEVASAQQKEQTLDSSIKSLQFRSEEELIDLRKKIKLIDADKIRKLEKQVQAVKERYKPLFSLYTSLNQQIAAAKGLKNKNLNALLRAQADTMKLAVHVARQEIKSQENQLASAKNAAKAAKKRIQETLSGMDALKVRIKAARSGASSSKKRIVPELKAFKQAIKKTNVQGTLVSLTAMANHSHQVVAHKQTILNLENQISVIITKAKAQLPSIR